MQVIQRLLSSLDRLIAKGTNEQTTLLLLSTLDLMQGLLLIHPPSRRLFVREVHMTILLDLLEPDIGGQVQAATLHTIVCALVDEWDNLRTFEALSGLESITGLFKRKDTSHAVRYVHHEAPKG